MNALAKWFAAATLLAGLFVVGVGCSTSQAPVKDGKKDAPTKFPTPPPPPPPPPK